MKSKIQVLVSTVNKPDDSFINYLNIDKSVAIGIVNQIYVEHIIPTQNYDRSNSFFYSFYEKGLSKSRNKALNNSDADICLICDDDVRYFDSFSKTIITAYDVLKQADIIIFKGKSSSTERGFAELGNNMRKLNRFDCLKVSSVLISFKRSSIINANIKFDERFGSGSGLFNSGEDNIFLDDCIKSGLTIFYYPEYILEKSFKNSLWFNGFDIPYFKSKGALFYRLFGFKAYALIIIFTFKKFVSFKTRFKKIQIIKYMYLGIIKFKSITNE